MKVTIDLEVEFKRRFKLLAKKYHSLAKDLALFKEELMENPFQGDDLGGGVRAISSKGKGKRGGARVLTMTVLISGDADVTLLTIYDKNEMENVSDQYITWLVSQYKLNKQN